MDQRRVDAFADATGDHPWLHVDTQRAADGRYGGTVAHVYLTLSLLPVLGAQIYRGTGAALVSATPVAEGDTQAVVRFTVEVQGQERPACVADTICRLLP